MTPEERKRKKAEYQRRWYERHRARHVANVAARNARVLEAVRARLWAYLLAHPCVDCGETDPLVLDFDHVRGDKVGEICILVGNRRPWPLIEAEIAKCDVRCANCHRRKTALESGHWKLRHVSLGTDRA
jgi:hypothetical protein